MIDYKAADDAIKYLVSTDEELARVKVLYEALYEQKKTIQAVQFLKANGSAAEKTQKALASEQYHDHLALIKDAQLEFEILRNKRQSQVSVIDMWRSVNSNQKKGNI